MNQELFDLSGRVALVTGASKGLGKSMALALAEAGADVALFARDVENLKVVKETIEGLGRKAEFFVADVLSKSSIEAAIKKALDTFGQLDILVNNAGVNVRKPVLEISPEEWDFVINTNLKGYLLMAQAVVPHMLSRGRGKVINMASILGSVALASQVAYASSKGGVIQMTKVMALEWATQGIQVNAIGPTYFETPLVAQLRNDPERYSFIVDRTPMGRWGQPEELAGVVVFLASRASDFVTGQTIFVDGGWTIW
ncbi:MAG: glucose 1-dehydrogenase [Desulfomonile tiedjei]|uniref:Glucose 1-dehydrogenase n=1 Tax=Desulfomonile tiedjei TaxID=2358 RepID=A0A9D6UXY6_9BACT|nr:glucose 1-dehydrogenase [Desulfomonile tiedjei]